MMYTGDERPLDRNVDLPVAVIAPPEDRVLAGQLRGLIGWMGIVLGTYDTLLLAYSLRDRGLPLGYAGSLLGDFGWHGVFLALWSDARWLGSILGLLLLTGAIGLVRKQSWARGALQTYAWLQIALALLTQISAMGAAFSRAQGGASRSPWGYSLTSMNPLLYHCVYPALLLICMKWRMVSPTFAQGTGGFAPIVSGTSSDLSLK